MTSGHVSNLADDWLDDPIGTTTPAMRTAARRCVARNVGDDSADVLQALGLSPYDQRPPPTTGLHGHRAGVRERNRKRKEAKA